ncbi:ac113 [Artaxa digramma nucleopolyhedrovirus]|uniref:Ac113 n=1 Tax=Artaxa digramma nucleopolyhedrovirus TaxID=3070910 RepID=A0AAE6V0I3_9ABAC|nr:ac113 [Euproctis digramma nucleopolyhedrovirus]QHB21759.1 ac113 [Artaxa digramma nucleopolyhedrovirus]
MEKNNAAEPCIVFVWFHRDQFVYNTYEFPFWHNVQHHALHHKCYLLYYIENDNKQQLVNEMSSSSLAPRTNVCQQNLILVNFKLTRHASAMRQIDDDNVACKIDYMKLQVLLDKRLIENEKILLVMDMDCVVRKIYTKAISVSERYLEPFFDRSVNRLYNRTSRMDFDSYIENYAVLINRNYPFLTSFQKFEIVLPTAKDKHLPNNYIYSQYLLMVHLYYTIFHNFSFPDNVKKLQYVNSVDLTYNRGGSWKSEIVQRYKYDYDVAVEPIFGNVCLCTQIYMAILHKDVQKIDQLIEELRNKKYNFCSRFNWSNSKQQYTNMAGVLIDKIPTYDFTKRPYLLPIYVYNQ